MNFELITHIWNVFVKSNTLNFVVFLLIFAWIFKKVGIKSMVSSLQHKVVKLLDEAKNEKDEADNLLIQAEQALEKLPEQLGEIIQDATKSADIISNKILNEAKKQVENIELNATKVIAAEEKLLIAKLTKNTSQASVEIAKSHIESVLEEAPGLHEKYINESIDDLDNLIDGVNF